jgi:hypothetical protein
MIQYIRFRFRDSNHVPRNTSLLDCCFVTSSFSLSLSLSLFPCLGSAIFFRTFCSQTVTVVVRSGEVRLSKLYPKATKAAKI